MPSAAEGEGKAHDETLAAGKVFGGADFSGLIAVDDVELQRLLLALKVKFLRL